VSVDFSCLPKSVESDVAQMSSTSVTDICSMLRDQHVKKSTLAKLCALAWQSFLLPLVRHTLLDGGKACIGQG